MMKKAILLIASILFSYNVNAQCAITAYTNTSDTINCGDSLLIEFNAFANSILQENFGFTGPNDTNWVSTSGAVYTNPYTPSPTNDPYFWMGTSPILPTALTSSGFDVTGGGQICFDFVYAVQGQPSPTEGPDQYDEGITLQYSIDGGVTWIDIVYYAPNGDTLPSNPGVTGPNVSAGSTNFTSWTSVCIDLPPGAMTANTSFQWIQENHSSANNDHWGLDNISIVTSSPLYNIYSVNSNQNLGPAPANFPAYTTGDSIFEFFYTDGGADTCYATYYSYMNETSLGPDLILDCNQNILQLQATGVSINDNFTWSPITGLSDVTILNPLASPLDTTQYIFTSSCGADTILVSVIANYSFSAPTDTMICAGDTVQFEVLGGAQTYAWTPNNSSISSTIIANPIVYPTTTTIYTITADSAGCIKTQDIEVSVSNINFAIANITDADCSGGANGSLAILPFSPNVIGGVLTYTLVSNTDSFYNTIPTFTGLSPNNYVVTLHDASDCPVSQPIVIGGGTGVFIDSIQTVDPLCVGANNGNIVVFVDDTSGITNYSLNGGATQTTPVFNNLTSGTYLVTVQRSTCPPDTQTVILSAPATISISFVDSTDLTCAGAGNGEIQVSATNGVLPYQFSNDNITFTNNGGVITSLAAGQHTIYVMDDNGCKDSLIASVSEPPAMIINNLVINPTTCFGDSTGSISFNVINGTLPYTYAIDSNNFGNANSFSNLPAGNYYLQVLDATGCPSSILLDSITSPSQLVLVEDSTQSSTCGAADGIVYVTASGGTINYTYSIDGGAGQPFGVLTGVTAGIHLVTVVDNNNCSQTISVVVSDNGAPALVITMADSVTCFGAANATVQLSATGGIQPFQFSVNGGPLNPDSLFLNLGGGIQNFIVQDAVGCQGTVDTVIFEPTQLDITATQDSTSCFGTNNGNIHLAASGGTLGYLYAIDNVVTTQISSDFMGYNAGNYMAYVIDANGCVDSVAQDVFEADTIIINNIITDSVNCSGAADGQITFAATGGVPTYLYSIDAVTFVTTNSFTVDTGTFNLQVQDQNGCTSSIYNTTVFEPTILVLDSITTVKSNCGLSNGMLEVLGSGGVSPYSYSINGGIAQPSGIFNGLASMNYTVLVTDANNCSQTINVFVALNSNITLSVLSFDSVTCNGLANATVTLQATGGILPYSYAVNGGATQTSPTFLNLTGGANVFTMTDSLGICTVTVTENIYEPTVLTISAMQDSVSCDDFTDGEIHITANGGLTPYAYALNNVGTTQMSPDFLGLSAGANTTYVIDANGCTTSVAQNVLEPDTLEIISTVAVDISCNANGSITVNPIGGTMPYTYSINGGAIQSSNIFIVTTGGTYTLSLFDANGCPTAIAVDSVIAPDPVTFVVDSLVANTSCFGLNDGYVSILASGGTAPYTYSFDNGTTFGIANNSLLVAGVYNVIVQDVFNCQSTMTVVTINEPNALNSTASSNTISCFGLSDGNIIINTITGGTAPYQVNIGGADVLFVPNLLFDNLATGNYTITVTDDNGCVFTYNQTVANVTDISLVLDNIVDVSCYGVGDGLIAVSATGGTPIYTFSLTDGATTTSYTNNNAAVFNALNGTETGITYPIVVTDANGCQKSFSQTIMQPNQLLIDSLSSVALSCFGSYDASITVNASGGSTPYTYAWAPTGYANITADGLQAGVHTVVVTDANGCTATMSETIDPVDPIIATIVPDSANITMGDTIQLGVIVQNAIGTNLQYSWTPTTGLSCTDCENPVITIYNDISYSVIVTDENGCSSYNITEMYVTVDPSLFFFVPNGFTPNGDGMNDDFRVYGQDIKTVGMMVFNRWGEKVFEGNTQFEAWDGTFKGVEQSTGVYSYVVDITFLNNATEQKKGSVSLIR